MGTFWSLVCCKEEAVPKPPGRQVGLTGEHAGLPPPLPKKQKNPKQHPTSQSSWVEKKWPCDFPSKGEKGKDEIIFAQRKGSPPQKLWRGFYLSQQGRLEELGSLSAPAPEGEMNPRGTWLQIPENNQGKNFSTLFKVL